MKQVLYRIEDVEAHLKNKSQKENLIELVFKNGTIKPRFNFLGDGNKSSYYPQGLCLTEASWEKEKEDESLSKIIVYKKGKYTDFDEIELGELCMITTKQFHNYPCIFQGVFSGGVTVTNKLEWECEGLFMNSRLTSTMFNFLYPYEKQDEYQIRED